VKYKKDKEGGAGSPRFYKGASPPLIEDIRGNKFFKVLQTLINKGFEALFTIQSM